MTLRESISKRVRWGQHLARRGQLWVATRAAKLPVPGSPEFLMAEAQRRPECCVGYFGLNRSLRRTAPSIALNIYQVFRRLGLPVTVIAHFNRPQRIHSPRSGENNVAATNSSVEQLGCELVWSEPQDEAKIQQLLDLVMKYPMKGEEDAGGVIRKNALLQMYSQSRLLQLIRMIDIDRFGVFCLARSDLLYLDAVPEHIVAAITDGKVDLVTPSWHRWGGLNDRFAFCSRRGAEVYLDRINWVSRFCEAKGYFHPEEILRFSAEQSGIVLDFTSMRALRVRSTGAVQNEDFSIVE